jgi:hypothetical protein
MSTTTKPSHGHGHDGGPASPESVAIGHELKDVRVRPLVFSIVGVFILLFASFGLVFGIMAFAGDGIQDVGNQLNPTAIQAQLPPGPLLEQNPRGNTDAIIAEQNAQLTSYGWVNERAGTARIPIDRAKELLLEQGVDPFNQ